VRASLVAFEEDAVGASLIPGIKADEKNEPDALFCGIYRHFPH
jgi:hypothetical protein